MFLLKTVLIIECFRESRQTKIKKQFVFFVKLPAALTFSREILLIPAERIPEISCNSDSPLDTTSQFCRLFVPHQDSNPVTRKRNVQKVVMLSVEVTKSRDLGKTRENWSS